MNRKQMIVIAIAAIAIAGWFLFPPWITLKLQGGDSGHMVLTQSQHRFINNPPEPGDLKPPYIAWRYPIQDSVAATIIAGILCFVLRTKKKRESIAPDETISAAAAF